MAAAKAPLACGLHALSPKRQWESSAVAELAVMRAGKGAGMPHGIGARGSAGGNGKEGGNGLIRI